MYWSERLCLRPIREVKKTDGFSRVGLRLCNDRLLHLATWQVLNSFYGRCDNSNSTKHDNLGDVERLSRCCEIFCFSS